MTEEQHYWNGAPSSPRQVVSYTEADSKDKNTYSCESMHLLLK